MGQQELEAEKMRIATLLAAAAVLAVPLAGGAQADGVKKPYRHYSKEFVAKHRGCAHVRHRCPRVAGFRFAAGGHAYGYEYESYARFNYGPPSRQFHGYFGYGPNFDNRTFAETALGGGIQFGGSQP
jgi:hypothetical protein